MESEFCEPLQLVPFVANVVTVLFYSFSLEHLDEIVTVGEILSFPSWELVSSCSPRNWPQPTKPVLPSSSPYVLS